MTDTKQKRDFIDLMVERGVLCDSVIDRATLYRQEIPASCKWFWEIYQHAQQKSNERFEALDEMAGSTMDGSQTTITIHQDDATNDFIVSTNLGRKNDKSGYGKTLTSAIDDYKARFLTKTETRPVFAAYTGAARRRLEEQFGKPHDRFIEALKQGKKLWRDDPLNSWSGWMHHCCPNFGTRGIFLSKPTDIECYGSNDLYDPSNIDDLRKLWEHLSHVPTDSDGRLREPFMDFEIGADQQDVWRWFEAQNDQFKAAEAFGLKPTTKLFAEGEFIIEVHDGVTHEFMVPVLAGDVVNHIDHGPVTLAHSVDKGWHYLRLGVAGYNTDVENLRFIQPTQSPCPT